MKTKNEQIAEIMGWHYDTDKGVIFVCGLGSFIDFELELHFELAKILQQKMVDDGWKIDIINWPAVNGQKPFKRFTAYAEKFDGKRFYDSKAEADTEPAAIVALFVKVYGIEK